MGRAGLWRLLDVAGIIGAEQGLAADLDRLIEAQVKAGNLLEAGCYSIGGKKFWHLSSPALVWEFNITTKKWNERWSLKNGVYGRTRATGGHPAFNKWLAATSNRATCSITTIPTSPKTARRCCSGSNPDPVRDFPQQLGSRAPTSISIWASAKRRQLPDDVLGAAAGSGGVVRLTVNQTSQAKTGDEVQVAGVLGTTEANGTAPMTWSTPRISSCRASKFVNAYISGGTATDITAASRRGQSAMRDLGSKDGGATFDNPSIRSLGRRARSSARAPPSRTAARRDRPASAGASISPIPSIAASLGGHDVVRSARGEP
jgi:hypothetical protein